MSTPPRRPRYPFSVTLTSYQVGRPWMFEGKMLRGLTGTPMRRMARANSSLAEADPEALTVANLTTKSLTAASARLLMLCLPFAESAEGRCPRSGRRGHKRHCKRSRPLRRCRTPTPPQLRWGGSDYALVLAAYLLRLSHFHVVLPHVPRAGRAAFGAQSAMQADILVLGHDAAGLEVVADIDVLRRVERRRQQAGAQIFFFTVVGEGDAIHRADVDAGVALHAERAGEHRLHVAVQAPLRLLEGELDVEAQLDLGHDVLQRLLLGAVWDLQAVVDGPTPRQA